jgi:CheY-like chemotaxis protein
MAAEAYLLASTVRLSAVITEVRMPGDGDGLSLTRRLRHDPALRRLPVVILSEFVFGSVREASASAGCDLFLVKPCPPEVLSTAIDTLVERTTMQRRRIVPEQEAFMPRQGSLI